MSLPSENDEEKHFNQLLLQFWMWIRIQELTYTFNPEHFNKSQKENKSPNNYNM